MIINQWYVADDVANITDKAKRVKLLGFDFVLFRDANGAISCLSDVCVHRGASRGAGRRGNRPGLRARGGRISGGPVRRRRGRVSGKFRLGAPGRRDPEFLPPFAPHPAGRVSGTGGRRKSDCD